MENSLKFKLVSSLEKCFLDDNIDAFCPLEELSFLSGEKVSFQLIYSDTSQAGPRKDFVLKYRAPLASIFL